MNYWSYLLDHTFKYLSMEARFYLVISLFSACPMDRYGVRCNETCPLCKNLGVCHPKNGSCICSPGFFGPLCDKSESFDIDLYDCYSIIHVQFIYTFVIINMSLTCMYCFIKKNIFYSHFQFVLTVTMDTNVVPSVPVKMAPTVVNLTEDVIAPQVILEPAVLRVSYRHRYLYFSCKYLHIYFLCTMQYENS